MSNAASISSICSLERDFWDDKKFGSSCKEGGNEDSATLFGPFVHRLSQHTEALYVRLMKIVLQLFLNNQKKRSNELIVKQNVAEFKRPKRKKTWMLIFNIPSICIAYYDY